MKKALVITVVLLALASGAWAQGSTAPDIAVTLSFDKEVYLEGEPIMATLTLVNGASPVVAKREFMTRDFRLELIFTDEEGTVITTHVGTETPQPEPLAPPQLTIDGKYLYVHQVEEVTAGWSWSETFDAALLYNLSRPVGYRVKAAISIRTYAGVDQVVNDVSYAAVDSALWHGKLETPEVTVAKIVDGDTDGYWRPVDNPVNVPARAPDCDDTDPMVNPGMVEVAGNGKDDDCNRDTADKVAAAPGTITLQADRHMVGPGSYPGLSKIPLAELPFRVYDKSSGSCVAGIGVSWQNYGTVWLSCSTVEHGFGETDGTGAGEVSVGPGDLLLVAMEDPDETFGNGDEVYIGRSVGALSSNDVIHKYVQIIEKVDGKKVPAKYKRRTGSELLIIEPEYTEWDGEQELYPFIFESVGDWSVTTSVEPPEGFVADSEALAAEVNTELEAVQFTITDIGSEWVATEVLHEVDHKGKKEKIKSKVEVKLTKRLARKKGLDQFGKKIKKQK